MDEIQQIEFARENAIEAVQVLAEMPVGKNVCLDALRQIRDEIDAAEKQFTS